MYILLIEDDAFFQKFYSVKLKEKQFEVDVAEDGEVGLLKIAQRKPDLILLDLIMPKKDGFEVLEALAKDPNLKTIPVLIFSTLGQEKDIQRAKALGARDVANKSFFDFDTLIAKINSLVIKK